MERNELIWILLCQLVLLDCFLYSIGHGLQGRLAGPQELLKIFVTRSLLRLGFNQFLLDFLELWWVLKSILRRKPRESTVLPGLRSLGKVDIVSICRVCLGGGIDHRVGQDAVSEVLEWLILLLGEAISVLVTLRNFATSGQPRVASDICEPRRVVRD